MSKRNRFIIILLAASAVAVILSAGGWFVSGWIMVEYQPVILDNRQELIRSPALATPDHLNRLERVLTSYGESYERVSQTKLLIPLRLRRDAQLLWNYSTKAEDTAWLAEHSPTTR